MADVDPHPLCTPPEQRLGLLLKKASDNALREAKVALEPLGINWIMYAALCAAATDHHTQKELASYLGVSENTIIPLADDLEARGLWRREPGADRRRYVLVLTAAGAELIRQADQLVMEAYRRLLAPIVPSVVEDMFEGLRKLAGLDGDASLAQLVTALGLSNMLIIPHLGWF